MLNVGEIIDSKYRIVRLIGEGGMGAVYEGENTLIHRRVAIKVLHPGQSTHAESVARFEREAQAAGRIGSEHIVEVLDLGTLVGGERYMVMEYLDGESLSERIRRFTRLSPEQTAIITLQLLEALSAAHGAGIVHRDLKPDNVYLLTKSRGHADFVKLLDFGISKFNQLSGDVGFSMTRTGAVMGTPYYMAPEQAKGARDIDHRVDIYAVGVILYECLTGEVPFKADTFNQLLFKIALEQPEPIEELAPGLDENFIAIVKHAMSRDPKDRFASAKEFQESLASWMETRGTAAAPAPAGTKATAVVGTTAHASAGTTAETNISASTHAGMSKASIAKAAVMPRTLSASEIGTHTSGTWANTQDGPKKSSTGIIAASALASLLFVGAAIAAYKYLAAPPADEASNPAASSSASPPAEGRAVAPPIAVPDPTQVPPSAGSGIAVSPVATSRTSPSGAASASQSWSSRPRAGVAVAPAAARALPRPKTPVTSKPAAEPRAPTPSQPAATSGPAGRKFRTTL